MTENKTNTGDEIMENKPKAESLIELCKIQMEHFKQTRSIEFKVNLALWTLIVLIGRFLYEYVNFTCCSWISYVIIAILISLGHFYCWMKPIQKSENRDLEFIYSCRKAIAPLHEPSNNDSRNRWIYSEVAITVLLLIAIALLLLSKT